MRTAVKVSLLKWISQGKDVVGKNDKAGPSIENIKGKVLEALAPMHTCYCSVAKLCLTLCDPMGCSTQGSLVLHYLLEFAHIHC